MSNLNELVIVSAYSDSELSICNNLCKEYPICMSITDGENVSYTELTERDVEDLIAHLLELLHQKKG